MKFMASAITSPMKSRHMEEMSMRSVNIYE